ncbi:MAG: hypothetical protein GZ091_11870 [Paludibacter sp.]|nr:hypothetical protein [Paludibacter sp.]
MNHNFELSLQRERMQAVKADAFYRDVLKVTEIVRFNSDSDSDMEMQRQDVDVLLTLNDITYRVSEKFRDKDYGDLYVEVYSKFPKTQGWLHTGTPNAILYFTPNTVYWITHKSLANFCLDQLFPLIALDFFLELYQSHQPIISKHIVLNKKPIKINLIQAHNSLPDGSCWETIGISAPFSFFEENGVKIRKMSYQ